MINQNTDIMVLINIATLVHTTKYKTKQSFGESNRQRLREDFVWKLGDKNTFIDDRMVLMRYNYTLDKAFLSVKNLSVNA